MNTKKQQIAQALKAAGYNNRKVTVKDVSGSLNWSFDVTIRDANVVLADVKAAANRFRDIDRCEASGEILSGGNTYIRFFAAPDVAVAWNVHPAQLL